MALAARRHVFVTQFFGFYLNCLVVMNTRQATESIWLDFRVLGFLGWFWSGGKTILIVCEWFKSEFAELYVIEGLIGWKIVWTWF